ncbi:MFS transporter [Oscillatoria sp. CS-180]|uniref:MFS transporter n=1 Tax=Oscillatoria sp. CS-180 TaxID=3021720 RepID=UPI00232D115C|nr:MFS transporter [Oscillatoria sp. CS-180]MDB9525623.1 MFS transporter [Oscillatoria sp. CS-180]
MTQEFSASDNKNAAPLKLPVWTKLAYGIGDMGAGMTSNLIAFFFLFFLTDVAGINPLAAGTVLLLGKIWDAVNDPLVGVLSDRTQTRWGRRYPWIFFSILPFGLTFILMWIVPGGSSGFRFWYYVAASILFQIFFTTSNLPYTTLTAELSQDYDERTDLTSFRLGFSLFGAISALALGNAFSSTIENTRVLYAVLGSACAIISIISLLICVFGTYPHAQKVQEAIAATQTASAQEEEIPFLEQLQIVFNNRAFLYVVGIYLFAWLALQVTASIIPFYTVFWMQLDDFFLPALLVQGTAILMMLPCNLLSRRIGKQGLFFLGIGSWLIVQIGLFFLQPGQTGFLYALCVAASFGVATAYVVPWAMLPDVIELDELRTGKRREGIFYAFMTLLQKIGLAVGLFLVGAALESSGFMAEAAVQPERALLAIRTFIGPVPLVLLCCSLVLCYLYPITRTVHSEILLKLAEQRQGQKD